MVNVTLVETILREQDDPGASTTRQIRDLYNTRSGEDPIRQHTDEDKEFQRVLLKALEAFSGAEGTEEPPISYTVKLKDADENRTPTMKRRSIIKLPKENRDESESDEVSSDSEKTQTTSSSSITLTKPFSPLFLNNMKKFGVSTDWLAKRSNSARHSSYSRSSIKSNTSQLDAMIKSASAKPIRSSRKLSFVETSNSKEEKENADPNDEAIETKKEENVSKPTATPYDLSSDEDEEKSKEFALRIPRVDVKKDKKARAISSSDGDDDNEGGKAKTTKKRSSKKPAEKTEKKNEEPAQMTHLKKLLRVSGIRFRLKNTELDAFPSDAEKIKYLTSLLKAEGLNANSSLRTCEEFRRKREEAKDLEEIQATTVNVKGHVKGGRVLRGQARANEESAPPTKKRKRSETSQKKIVITLSSSSSSSSASASSSSDDEEEEKARTKKRRVRKAEASPEVSENEWESTMQ